MSTTTLESPVDLGKRWADLRVESPKIRIRDAAQKLGVSEAELLATTVDGKSVVRLVPRFRELFAEIPALGKVMALTRNDEAVHERKGVYDGVDMSGHAGLVVGPDIDLRIFFHDWKHGFAIQEPGEGSHGPRRSLQIFDSRGNSIHKIFVQDEAAADAFSKIVENYRAEEQGTTLEIAGPAPRPTELPDSEIDVQAFRTAWDGLQDTHDFFTLLRTHKVGRTQALRLAETSRARELRPGVVRALLEAASARELPIMIFVGNQGCIQIHTGPVRNIKVMGPWLNVMDPDFNLHLREDLVKSAWIVRKPTRDGVVTSVELYNAEGDNIALIFGKRKPGQPEATAWQELAAKLEQEHSV